jgi:hypothetical protein
MAGDCLLDETSTNSFAINSLSSISNDEEIEDGVVNEQNDNHNTTEEFLEVCIYYS